MQTEKKNGCFPNLDKHLKERGSKLVSYKEGAEIYEIPYYSFARLAKEAGANYTLRKSVVIDIDMDCLLSNTTKVCNIKKYILAALFNAPTTMGGYFRAEVNHDMPQLAKAR